MRNGARGIFYSPRRNRECLTTTRLRGKRLASTELRNDNYDRVRIANFLEKNPRASSDFARRQLAETFSILFVSLRRKTRAVRSPLYRLQHRERDVTSDGGSR